MHSPVTLTRPTWKKKFLTKSLFQLTPQKINQNIFYTCLKEPITYHTFLARQKKNLNQKFFLSLTTLPPPLPLPHPFPIPPKKTFISKNIFHTSLKESFFYPKKKFIILTWITTKFLWLPKKNNFPNKTVLFLFWKTNF